MNSRIEVTDKVFTIPELDYEVLVVEQGKSRSQSLKGAVKEVKVTPAGVKLHFLSGGGQPMQPCVTVVYREPPKAPEPAPVRTESVVAPLPTQSRPTGVSLPALDRPPKGESLDVSDSADATVTQKE